MPVFNANEKIRRGEIKREDVPYMQRGGKWVSIYQSINSAESRDEKVRSVSNIFVLFDCPLAIPFSTIQDNSDIRGARKSRWLNSDKKYASGGYKKEQSVSMFGYGEGLDWSGRQARQGPSQSVPGKVIKFPRGYKAPNVNAIRGKSTESKKKFFGLF